ncbi:MAG: glycosyltransferase family 2 protein [Patescibacteria group bacterium]
MPDVDVSIVTWNSAPELRALLESLQAQTLQPASITIVDNASTDSTQAVCANFSNMTVLPQATNVGFAAGHNLGIAHGRAEFVLVVNPDVILSPTYLEQVLSVAEALPKAAAFTGVLRRADGRVDTTGVRVQVSRIVRDRLDVPVLPQSRFGISGAAAFYRRAALQDVAVGGQFFAETFFAYKEDVQLAWRLQWAGWGAYCVPAAVATHQRNLAAGTRRSARDAQRRFFSYRNHLLLYPSAESFSTVLPDLWAIVPTEIARLLFLLVTDFRVTLRALAAAGKMWHAARTFAAQQRRSVPSAQVRKALFA